MKKLIVVSAVAVSSMAFAGDYKFNLEGRYDFINSKVTTGSDVDKVNTFSNGTIRLNMFSKVNDNLSFRFRFRFAKGAPALTTDSTTREETGTQLDYLYVDHKNSFFTTRFGKQNWAEAMGRETFVSATDAFVKSQAYSDYQTAFGSDYRAGVSALFTIMDTNNLTVAISNPNATMTDGTANNENTGLAYGVHYNGNFMNKLIQPVLSYQSAKQNGDIDNSTAASKTKDATNTVWAAGLRSEFSGLVLDVDYKQVKAGNRNAGTNTAFAASKTTSVMVNAAYTINEFTPFAAYINDKAGSALSSTSTGDATTAFKKNTFALGVQYKPYADVNFRYHLAYASSKKEKDRTSTAADLEDKKIMFGIKADI